MKSKFALAAALVAGTVAGISTANANPIYIGYSINGGAITLASTSVTGSDIFAGVSGNVTFGITATGSPILSEPNFFTGELIVRNATAGAATNVRIFLSQTGLTTTTDKLETAWTNNALSSGSVTVSSYAQDCIDTVGCANAGDIFATTGLIYTTAAGVNTAGFHDDTFPATVTGLYNETLVYNFNLAAGQRSSATLNLSGINVPEPLTLSLFGAGLAGMAAVRRRKKKQAA